MGVSTYKYRRIVAFFYGLLFSFLTEFLFPLWKTFRMLFNRTKNDEVDPSIAQVERVQWTMYWIQFAIVRWLLSFPFSQLIVNK